MLLKRNLLEIVTVVSCSSSVIGIFLNYVTDISPITGFWFISYIVILFIISVIFSFNCIQWLLQLNKPLKYDVEGVIAKYPYLSFLRSVSPQIPRVSSTDETKEYDTNELSIISTVLEKKLVSSWYVPYISQEIGFPFACKQMLDQMIGKTFKICDKIEIQEVYVDICAVLISHLKEYKKALKRHEKFPNNAIDTLYKKSHPVSDKNKKHVSADHCTNILRIVMKELIPWELWDTPHSEILVRILSKKLDNLIDTTISDPVWLNDKLHTLLNVEEQENNVTTTEDVNDDKTAKETLEKQRETPIVKENIPDVDLPKDLMEEVKEEKTVENENIPTQAEPVDIKPTAVLRHRRGRQGRNEVKIYDRIIEGSVKTWETDMDLQCISVGQDLLAGLDDVPLSRLWGPEDTDHSPNIRNASPQPLWFGEEDAIDLDLEPQKEVKKELSPKPTDALLKDIQTTVHQAKTKIGDLQVPKNVDVPCKHSGDEAAGMMEGLLDKGIAGLKKGLRFTGLSDEPQEKSPSHQRDKGHEKTSPDLSRGKSRPEPALEGREINIPGVKEDNGNAIHLLVKQQRVTSQDSMASPGRGRADSPAPLSESPELEYEEAADLSASIAKLRELLQHAPREEVWWEGAEETRGRTQLLSSSRPVDSATMADEYDMNLDRNTSPGQTTNNMQRLDKLFQRTVTGVFNSIKTAVGGEEAGEESAGEAGRASHDRHWTYVCSAAELSVGGAVARLVGGRRALAHVDAALDSLQMSPPPAPPPLVPEELEEWCMSEGGRWSGSAELLCAAGLLHSHLALRAATLLCADVVEALVRARLARLGGWLRRQVFAYFQQLGAPPPARPPYPPQQPRPPTPLDLERTCRLLRENIPETYLFSEDTLTAAIRLVVSSFSHKDINRDVIFRILDILVMHFKKSGGLRNPSFDNN